MPQKTKRAAFQSMQVAYWEGDDGRKNYSIFALSTSGQIYRWSVADSQWLLLALEED